MIEAFFRQLKHGWLYLNNLTDFATLRRHIDFYVREHNTVVPHAAFRGQTPDEMYFGRGEEVVERLAEGRRKAREFRVQANRQRSCDSCPTPSGRNPRSGWSPGGTTTLAKRGGAQRAQ